jgi:subtilase family serine protease
MTGGTLEGVAGRFTRVGLCAMVVLGCWRGIALAQELAPIPGNHLNNLPFTAELPGSQQLRMAVVMGLNHRDQLEQLLTDLQDRDSPAYHRWLTPQQFADQFGPTTAQTQAIANWLSSQGLAVSRIDPLNRMVLFTGPYSGVKAALQTKIFGDGLNYGNVSDPLVPVVLAPTIVSIEGLYHAAPAPTDTDVFVAECTDPTGCNNIPYFGPSDLYTFYDENTVLEGGNLGTGANDCIALPEDGSFNPAVLGMFTHQFATALPTSAKMPAISYAVAPNGMPIPPLASDSEPDLDIEWVHAVSPNTPIRIYYTNGGSGYLGAIQQAVTENLCGAISSSVEGKCQSVATIKALDDVEAQGTVQGQTIFKSSGDYGDQWYCGSPIPAALPNQQAYSQSNCSSNSARGYTDAKGDVYQPSIDEEAASASITVVGGTEFQPSYAPSPAGEDLSNIEQDLELVWNAGGTPTPGPTPTPTSDIENCPVKDASGGGPSVIFPKPAWQAGIGVPNDDARDIPDVAMGASGDKPGFFVATQTLPTSSATPGPLTFAVVGGTSIATPMWAGVSRLIAQAWGVTRLGNINSRLYELGNLQSSNSGLHDIEVGDNTDNQVVGYNATIGYDLVTGWGSPDIAKLVAAFPGAAATFIPVNTIVIAGASASAGGFTLSNATGGQLYLNSVTIGVTSPGIFSSLKLVARVGTNTPQAATALPSASSLFTFFPPVVIPSADKVALALQGVSVAQMASKRMLVLAGGTNGGGYHGAQVAGYRLLWVGGLGVALAWLFLGEPRRRADVTLIGLMLIGLATLAVSCGDNSNNRSPTPSPSLTATPTPAIPTPAPTPAFTATPTPGPTVSSSQTIAQGAIIVSDGNGGIIEVSGLPGALGSVTVQY